MLQSLNNYINTVEHWNSSTCFFLYPKVAIILLEVFIPFEAEKKKKSDTHPPTNPIREANFPHLTIRLIACEAWWAWQKKRHFICRSVSYLKCTKSCLVFLWGQKLERCSNKHDSFPPAPARKHYTNSETYVHLHIALFTKNISSEKKKWAKLSGFTSTLRFPKSSQCL